MSITKFDNVETGKSTSVPAGGLAGSLYQSKKRVNRRTSKLYGKYKGIDRKGKLVSIKNENEFERSMANIRFPQKAKHTYEVLIHLDNGKVKKILMNNLRGIHISARVILEY